MSDDDGAVDVASALKDAMYLANDCWEFVESESARGHIDDAIHHLKAARDEVRDAEHGGQQQ